MFSHLGFPSDIFFFERGKKKSGAAIKHPGHRHTRHTRATHTHTDDAIVGRQKTIQLNIVVYPVGGVHVEELTVLAITVVQSRKLFLQAKQIDVCGSL